MIEKNSADLSSVRTIGDKENYKSSVFTGYAQNTVHYSLNMLSVNGELRVQNDSVSTNIDDIIVTRSVPEVITPDASPSATSTTRTDDFKRGFLYAATGGALVSGVLMVGVSPLVLVCLAPAVNAFANIPALDEDIKGGTKTMLGGLGSGLSSLGAAAVMLQPGMSSDMVLTVIALGFGATVNLYNIGTSAMAMAMCPDKHAITNGGRLASGAALGCLAGMLLSASVVDTALEPPHKPYPMNQRVEVHMDTTSLETAPRLTEDGAEYIPKKIVPRETAPRLN